MSTIRAVLVTTLVLPFCSLIAADEFAGLDKYAAAVMRRWETPGVAIAVVKDGETILLRGYGVAEIGTDRKVRSDTAFTIASCTKSFVATAIAILVEDGKLGWDDPVAKHLPGFELANEYLTHHVTLRDLLCHRTGLRRADLLIDGAAFRDEDIFRRLKLVEPIAELRTQYIYNNHMYFVLCEVVTRAAGVPWQEFIAQKVFQPLKMRATVWTASEVPLDQLALRHWRSDEGIAARSPPRTSESIYSTVADMAKWLKLQLAEGTFDQRRLLAPATVREMHSLQFSIPVKSRSRDNIYAAQFLGSGLGWTIQDYRGRKMVSHGGAWGAIVAMIPEEKLGVVVLANLDNESVAQMLAYDVFDFYVVGPEVAWSQKKWDSTWLRNDPPGYAFKPRDEAKARLEKNRVVGTMPSAPLSHFVGLYESPLYGSLTIQENAGQMHVMFGEFTTPLTHWQDDSFYARSPTRLTYDWLLTFRRSDDGIVESVIIRHIGWDKDERDHAFRRRD